MRWWPFGSRSHAGTSAGWTSAGRQLRQLVKRG